MGTMMLRSDAWRRPDRPPSNPPLVAAFFHFLPFTRLHRFSPSRRINPADQTGKTLSAPDFEITLDRLAGNRFRARFKLGSRECNYIRAKGIETIQLHAKDLIEVRLAPQEPDNDGKQTPFRGHPVFIAQHATATCCRSCLNKWHAIPKNVELDQAQKAHVVGLIIEWIKRQLKNTSKNQGDENKKGVDTRTIQEQFFLFDIDSKD